jgi:hypothetical protein
MRLLHPGDRVAEDALCPVLHRVLDKTGPCRGFDQSARLSLGHSAGAEPGDHRTSLGQAHPRPRSRRQVLRWLRRGPPNRRTGGREDPIRAPKANAFAERWVGSVRRECLDHVLVFGRRHLQRVLGAFVKHYNRARPHRGLDLQPPDPGLDSGDMPGTKVRRRYVLGGLIHEYHRSAASSVSTFWSPTAKEERSERRQRTPRLLPVHPTGQYSNKYPQVEGLPVVLSKRHAKIRRDGYRRQAP